MNLVKMNSLCKGCRYLKFSMESLCLFRKHNAAKICPCIDCLVKIICHNAICDKRSVEWYIKDLKAEVERGE